MVHCETSCAAIDVNEAEMLQRKKCVMKQTWLLWRCDASEVTFACLLSGLCC